MVPPVLITRVREEAEPWVRQLTEAGVPVELLPLIDIAPAPDAAALQAAWSDAGPYDAIMFVSASAARRFFAAAPADRAVTRTRFWATGPGTRRALVECGCAPAQIDAPADDAGQFDSEALWQGVQTQVRPGLRVLIVRGADAQGRIAGRDWLALQLEAAGVQVTQVAAYMRRCPRLDEPQRQRALQAAHDGSVWWFSSSEAITNLASELPGPLWGAARALATHPRIAEAARDAGFGQVITCRADLPELLASIKSWA